MRARVLVVGAGIGGLTAALAVLAAGHDVEVYEQAPALGEVGAGVTVSRGAQRVFAELGVLADVLARASTVRSNAFLHYRTGALLDGAHDFSDGAPDPDAADRPPERNLQIHRADLHDTLACELERRAPGAVRLGRRLVDVTSGAGGAVARFAGGDTASGDLLVGADGLRSSVREVLWGPQTPSFTGQVAFRFLVPAAAAAPFVDHVGRAAVYFGPDRVFNRYGLRRGDIVNAVAIARTDSWHGESWTTPASTDELVELYRGWHTDVLGLMRAAPAPTKWALYDREPLPGWSRGRVTLLGDAAHPMLPFLGLGSAMAVEDASVLGHALADDPGPAGLARYEAARRPRTREVMLASREEGRLVQARDPERFDAAAAPSRDPTLYDFDPLATPAG